MNDKVKNIISNLLGLIISGASVTMYLLNKVEMVQFGVVLLVGLSLFLFKASKTRSWIDKIITKKLK